MKQDSNPGGIVLGVFGKLPGAEPVKTRLRSRLSQWDVERFYLASLADTLETAGRVVGHPVLFLPDAAGGVDRAGPLLLDAGLDPSVWRRVRRAPQLGDGLGPRLENAFSLLLEGRAAAKGALIVGSDSPSLPSEMLFRAFETLAGADLVLGPAIDGGYYAIGLHAYPAGLLDGIPWSTEHVLESTRARAQAFGMRVALLETWTDVDRPEDLEVLASQIAARRGSGDPLTARHTAAVLASLAI
jgi:rSAM/selenodomain-associated transferase 1